MHLFSVWARKTAVKSVYSGYRKVQSTQRQVQRTKTHLRHQKKCLIFLCLIKLRRNVHNKVFSGIISGILNIDFFFFFSFWSEVKNEKKVFLNANCLISCKSLWTTEKNHERKKYEPLRYRGWEYPDISGRTI